MKHVPINLKVKSNVDFNVQPPPGSFLHFSKIGFWFMPGSKNSISTDEVLGAAASSLGFSIEIS